MNDDSIDNNIKTIDGKIHKVANNVNGNVHKMTKDNATVTSTSTNTKATINTAPQFSTLNFNSAVSTGATILLSGAVVISPGTQAFLSSPEASSLSPILSGCGFVHPWWHYIIIPF